MKREIPHDAERGSTMTSLVCGAAVITFNGMKYLPQQLESIISQTRAVQHIVISDDNSTDGTWEYLEDWAKRAPVRVTLVRNQPQLGLIANYEQAVSMVEADIVFGSDQDDIWLPDKVELMTAVFENHPEVQLVHTDAILIDGNGQELATTLLTELVVSDRERNAVREGRAYEVYFRRNLVTGATAAFRKKLLDLARPLPSVLYQDAWLAFMASAVGKVHLLDVPTIRYRVHGSNMVGVKVGTSKQGLVAKVRDFYWTFSGKNTLNKNIDHALSRRMVLHERLSSCTELSSHYRAMMVEALQFAQRRKALRTTGRNPIGRAMNVLQDAARGRYLRYSDAPWSETFHDILHR
jgi:glycosyltransferase involved in cell wall biosynthesis